MKRFRRLTRSEVLDRLPTRGIIGVRWMFLAGVMVYMARTKWSRTALLKLSESHEIEATGPLATRAGWGMRLWHPGQKGWMYLETRRPGGPRSPL